MLSDGTILYIIWGISIVIKNYKTLERKGNK